MNRKRPLPILKPKASQQKRSREARHIDMPRHQNQFQHMSPNPQNPRFLPQNLPPFDFPSSVRNGLQASSQLMLYQPSGSLNPGFPPLNPAHHVQNANEIRNFSHFVPHLQQPGPPQNTQLALQGPTNFQLPSHVPTKPFWDISVEPASTEPIRFSITTTASRRQNFHEFQQQKFQMLQARQQGSSGLPAGALGNGQPIPSSQVVPLPPPQNISQNPHAPASQNPLGHSSQKLVKLGPREVQLIQDVLKQIPPLLEFPPTSQVEPVPGAHELQMPNAQEHVLRDLLRHPAQTQLATQPESAPLQNSAMPHTQKQKLPFNVPLLAQPKTCLAPQLTIQTVPSSVSDFQNVPEGGASELQVLQSALIQNEPQEPLQEQSSSLQPVAQQGPGPLEYPEMPTLYPEVLAQDQLPQDKLPPSQPPKLVSQLQDHAVPDFQNMHSSEPQVIQNPLGQTAQPQKVPPTLEEPRTDPNELNPLPRTVSIPEEVPNSEMVYQKVLKILQQASHEMLKPVPQPQPDPAQLELTKYSAILKHLFGSKSLEKFHRDPSSLPHHFQFQLLTVPPNVPAPQTLEHLEEIVKFNQDKITKKSSKEEWILEKLEQFGGLHKKKIDLFKSCEFREDFLVKLYYKYHQILIGSSSTKTVAFDDMEPFKKWMCTNAHCHREMVEMGEKLEGADGDVTKQVMKELRKAVKRSTKRLEPVFWRGWEEIQDVMLKAIGKPEVAAIVRREIKRGIRQLERAQNEPAVVGLSDVEDYDEVGDKTSRIEPEVAPHSSMAPHSEKRKEKDGLVDGQEENEVNGLDDLASTAKPQEFEDGSPGSSEDQLCPDALEPSTPPATQEPEAAIDSPVCCIPSTSNLSPSPQTTQNSETCDLPASTSKIYNVPIDLTMNPSQLENVFVVVKELVENTKLKELKVVILTDEQTKLESILKGLKENCKKLSMLNIEKPRTVNRIKEQESNLRRVIIRKKEIEDSISILKAQKEEHQHFLKEAEEEVGLAKQKYEEKVKETEEYSQEVFVVKNSGSILSDAWKAIDLMESSRFASLCSHVKERRKLMEDLQMKMNVVVDGKKEIEKIEEKTKLAEEKLKRTELKVKEESEKLEADKEKLREIAAEIETMENERGRLGGQKKESENLIEEVKGELEMIGKTCQGLEQQIHCSEKPKQTKSVMTSPIYPLLENNIPASTSTQGSGPKRSYLRKLISREFAEPKPRIILKISREKFREADRIRREQEREMEKEEEEEEIEREMNDDQTDGGGEEGRAQQALEAVNDKIEGRRPKENKRKGEQNQNIVDEEECSPPKQRKNTL
ncbi:unnamed protein product [Caenorhabditis brenneri]